MNKTDNSAIRNITFIVVEDNIINLYKKLRIKINLGERMGMRVCVCIQVHL